MQYCEVCILIHLFLVIEVLKSHSGHLCGMVCKFLFFQHTFHQERDRLQGAVVYSHGVLYSDEQ